MKQGKASHSGSGSTKSAPVASSLNPAGVARQGIMQGNHSDRGTHKVQHVPIYRGRGLEAPTVSKTVHPKGSQR